MYLHFAQHFQIMSLQGMNILFNQIWSGPELRPFSVDRWGGGGRIKKFLHPHARSNKFSELQFIKFIFAFDLNVLGKVIKINSSLTGKFFFNPNENWRWNATACGTSGLFFYNSILLYSLISRIKEFNKVFWLYKTIVWKDFLEFSL